MNNFSMSSAWSQGFGFVKDNLVTCLIFAAIAVIVPQLLQVAAIGGSAATMMSDPITMGGLDNMASMMGVLGLVSILGAVIQYGMYFAAWRKGLQDVPMGSAIIYGLIAGLTSLLAAILIALILMLPLLLFVGGSVAAMTGGGDPLGGSGAAGLGLFAIIATIAWFLFFIWFMARTIAAGPWMADNGAYNPFTGLANSWRMTGQGQWAIFGYLLLLFIGALIIALIFGGMLGVGMLGMMGGDPTAAFGIATLFGMVVGIPLTLVYIAIPVGIYLNLREEDSASIFG
jgi:hypothetical protein